MSNPFAVMFSATRTVLGRKGYALWFCVLTAGLIAAYILLPVWLTPGNSVAFQLQLLRPRDYVLFVLLSSVTALLILMQAYLFARSREERA